MARAPRVDIEGIHHVWARGNDRRRIFLDDLDRRAYLAILGLVVRRMRWRCLAYCLMDNHVHLLLELDGATLARGMQRLHGLYGQSFNERHRRAGHIFQGRYGSKLMTSDEQLWWTVAYVANNPVEAGLCGAARDWHWGSHAAVREGSAPPWLDHERVHQLFEGAGGSPEARYAELVGD